MPARGTEGSFRVEVEARSLGSVVHHRAGGGGRGVGVGRFGSGCAGGGALVLAEDGLEGRHAGASDGDCELDHGPEIDGNTIAEGVIGLGVNTDGVEADDGGNAGEGPGAEGQKEGNFLFSRALDGAEGFEWEAEDPEIGDNVEAGGRVEESGSVDAAPLNSFGKVPHLLQWPTLGESDDKADEEEQSVEHDRALTEHAEGSRHSKPKIRDEDRGLDTEYVYIVQNLDGQSRLDEADHVVGGKLAHREPYMILSEDEQHDRITDRQNHR